jgi:large subunit ribosomal protein L13Ae
MFEKVIVVDCSNHMLGRVASTLAKELMNGQKVVCVRTEELNLSGSIFRHKILFARFLTHRGNTKPSRGPNHYRAPSRILWRTIRGMIPHKGERGKAALDRLKVFEGCPHPFDKMKKQVIPQALRVLRLKPGRKFCRLGDLSTQVGWQHDALVQTLEAKRKTRAAAFYIAKKQLGVLTKRAKDNVNKKHGPAPGEQKAAEKPVEDPNAKGGKKGGDKGGKGKAGDKTAAGAKAGDKAPQGDKAAAAAGGAKGGDKPAAKGGDKPAKGGDKPAKGGDKPAGDKPAKGGDKPAKGADKPAKGGDKPAGDKPAKGGDKPAKGADKAPKGDKPKKAA